MSERLPRREAAQSAAWRARRAERDARRSRTRPRGDAYETSLAIGTMLRAMSRPLDRSKYSPDECRRQGKR